MEKKILIVFFIIVVLVIGMLVMLFNMPVSPAEPGDTMPTAAPTDWGLSFQTEGAAPVGNATAEYLKDFGAYYLASDNRVYLTFDSGYENGYTEKILDVLKEEKVPAAFFLVGNYIEENPELVKRMEAEGHIVGNHTMTHPDMSAIEGQDAFEREICGLEDCYKEATGKEMKKFYRPPQGKYSEANLEMAQKLGYKTIFWSLAYVHWYENDQPTREDALNTLNSRIHPGAIVLLHSTSKTNSEILKELIQGWKKMGFEFGSIEELK